MAFILVGEASRRLAQRAVRRSGLFDSHWYLDKNRDVLASGMDPIEHYLRHGAGELRDPSPVFNTQLYLLRYPELQKSGANPLIHAARGRTVTDPFDFPGVDRIVICNGMPRSASTWSFNVVKHLLRLTSRSAVYGGYGEEVGPFLLNTPKPSDIVMKCHTLDSAGRILVESGRAKAIYTRRDAADAIASSMEMFGQDFEEAFVSIAASLELYRFHRECGTALIIDYGSIVEEPAAEIARVAGYLSADVNRDRIAEIVEATSLEETRRHSDKLAADPANPGLERFGEFLHDRETLLHPAHVRDGRSGQGRNVLSAAQIARVDDLELSWRAASAVLDLRHPIDDQSGASF